MSIATLARRFDDAALDRLQAVVAKIQVRTGADKEETTRNLHALGAVVCVAWTAGSATIAPWLVFFPGINVFLETTTALAHHRRIGNAETLRGWETAAREAAMEREACFVVRTIMVSTMLATFAFVACLVVYLNLIPDSERSGGWTVGAVVANVAPIVWLVMVCTSRYLKAVAPPHPGTRKATEHVGRMVSQT